MSDQFLSWSTVQGGPEPEMIGHMCSNKSALINILYNDSIIADVFDNRILIIWEFFFVRGSLFRHYLPN